MSVRVQIYTWSNCPYCLRAKTLLEQRGIPYTEINLDGKEDELNALRARTGWQTVPQIFIGEKLIGGYTDLAELDAKGELNNLLNA
jgi:glutaredoxin 3